MADLVMGSCLTAAMVWKGMGKGAGGITHYEYITKT